MFAQTPPPSPQAALFEQVLREQRANRHDVAINLLTQEMAKNPTRELKRVLTAAYVFAERFDEAIKINDQLMRDEPGQIEYVTGSAFLHASKGDLVRATELVRKVTDATTSNPSYLINLSSIYTMTRPELAFIIQEDLYRVYPDNAIVANNLAFSLAERGKDLERALTLAQFAVSKQPNEMPLVDTLGWVYFKLGRFEEALPLLCRSLSMRAEDTAPQGHVRKTLEAMGNLTPEQRDLLNWLRFDDEPERVPRIRELAAALAR